MSLSRQWSSPCKTPATSRSTAICLRTNPASTKWFPVERKRCTDWTRDGCFVLYLECFEQLGFIAECNRSSMPSQMVCVPMWRNNQLRRNYSFVKRWKEDIGIMSASLFLLEVQEMYLYLYYSLSLFTFPSIFIQGNNTKRRTAIITFHPAWLNIIDIKQKLLLIKHMIKYVCVYPHPAWPQFATRSSTYILKFLWK